MRGDGSGPGVALTCSQLSPSGWVPKAQQRVTARGARQLCPAHSGRAAALHTTAQHSAAQHSAPTPNPGQQPKAAEKSWGRAGSARGWLRGLAQGAGSGGWLRGLAGSLWHTALRKGSRAGMPSAEATTEKARAVVLRTYLRRGGSGAGAQRAQREAG